MKEKKGKWNGVAEKKGKKSRKEKRVEKRRKEEKRSYRQTNNKASGNLRIEREGLREGEKGLLTLSLSPLKNNKINMLLQSA